MERKPETFNRTFSFVLNKYISLVITVFSFFDLFQLCYEYSRFSMTLLFVPLGTSGGHTCFLVIYYLFIEYLQYLPDDLLFYFGQKRRVRVDMLFLYTFATTVAEKYVYTCLYVTSASFSDIVFRRDGATCLRNMQLCLLGALYAWYYYRHPFHCLMF
jgi:hypothetical protein